MSAQAQVRISNKEWLVTVATTDYELLTGLSGISAISPGTGMLFDLGYDTQITVTTERMLFPLDIAFISASMVVVGVARNVQPGYLITSDVPARYFLEVNAGELEGIDTGDRVSITFIAQQIDNYPVWISSIVTMVTLGIVFMMLNSIMKGITHALLGGEQKYLPQVEPKGVRELKRKWFEKGIEAGRTEGWMNVEETMPETLRDHPEFIKDASDLVWLDIEGWEDTDHFNIIYGSKMWEDAKGDIDIYSDLKAEFWEGYLQGRKEIGIDIYKKAQELLSKSKQQEFLPQLYGKRGEVCYVVDLSKPDYIQNIVLSPDGREAVFWQLEMPICKFRPTWNQIEKIKARKGRVFIYGKQMIERFDTYEYKLQCLPHASPRFYWKCVKCGKLHSDNYVTWYGATCSECKSPLVPVYVPSVDSSGNVGTSPLMSKALALKDLKIKETDEIWGNAAYNHHTGEILVPPHWKPEPFYLVSIAHEVGHMLHHQQVGTEEYEHTPYRKAEEIAWKLGLETAKAWGIEDEYKKAWRNEMDPFGIRSPSEIFGEKTISKPSVIPVKKSPRKESGLEYLADSPEFLTQTIEDIGYRSKLDTAFQEAIRRAKQLR